jgi:iron-sulfur cluster assembly protein
MKHMKSTHQIITITDSAICRIKELIAKRDKPTAGIRIAIRTKGCSGLSYTIEYADDIKQGDEKIKIDDTSLFIDPKAVLFIIGSEMDYEDGVMQKGFIFRNPNEKGRCGCGQSFTV